MTRVDAKSKIKRAASASFQDTLDALLADAASARATIKAIMDNEQMPAAARLRAAGILLDTGIQASKLIELERELEQLRAYLDKSRT